jgi:hypothetical protein
VSVPHVIVAAAFIILLPGVIGLLRFQKI